MYKHLITICVLSVTGFAQIPDPDPRSDEDPLPLPTFLHVIADPDQSMRATGEDLLSLHTGLSRLEDRMIGIRWFDESSIPGKTGGLLIRLGKLAILDLPVDYFTIVVQHEIGGHGARYRELDVTDVHYDFDLPPPYGKGGGEATASGTGFSVDEAISMWSGGVESHTALQQGLAHRWMERRRVTYREAFLYFWSWQIAFNYINETNEDLLDGGPDNDPRAYVRLLNSGFFPLAQGSALKMTVADLKSATQVGVVNPFMFYSVYVAFVTYLWQGRTDAPLPILEVGPFGWLPLLRAGWTPFGIEYHMENYLRLGDRTALLDLRVGDNTFHSGWGGVGFDVHRIVDDGHWRLDAGLKLWYQPSLTRGWNPGFIIGEGVGGAWSLRVYQDIHDLPIDLHAVGEIGHKSGGFVEGYPLGSSPFLLMGLAIRY